MTIHSWLRAVVGFTLCVMLGACETVQTTQGGVVGVERKQQFAAIGGLSPQQMNGMAAKEYAQVTQEAQQKHALNANAAQSQRVRAIANRLIPQTAVFRPDAPGWAWEVNVIQSDELNAWCMPGGKIAVYSGLIDKLQLTDDELAAVMGHEIAHALREHSREKASQALPAQLGVTVLGALYGQDAQDLSAQAYQLLVGLPNSREMEVEADRIGIELAARAGYDPHAAINIWQKMAKASNGQPPQFLSTHPSHESRVADLTEYAQRVMPLYEQARRRG